MGSVSTRISELVIVAGARSVATVRGWQSFKMILSYDIDRFNEQTSRGLLALPPRAQANLSWSQRKGTQHG